MNNLFGSLSATVTSGVGNITNALLNADLTNHSFAAATRLPAMSAGPNGSSFVSYRGSLGQSSEVDYYRLQAPVASSGTTGNVLTAMVWGLQNQLNARVRVYDAQHNLVPATVVVNDGFTYTVQISDPTPAATYYVEVSAADPNAGQNVGNYFLGLAVTPNGILLQNFESATLTPSQPRVLDSLTVSQVSQLFHFVLSASAAGSSQADTVRMTITNATGQNVFTLVTGTSEPITGNVDLPPGAYTVQFAGLTSAGAFPASLAVLLRGDILTSPIGPEPTDTTTSPSGSPNPDPQNQDLWTGGSNSNVPTQDPSSGPYSPPNQATVSLYNPGDQTNDAGDQVDLPLQASASAQDPLTFSENGLPAGLNLDPDTGVIYGAIANNAASPNSYVVTVTATDNNASASASQTFYWTVNQPIVTLTNPGDQTNSAGDAVSLQLSTTNSDGYALTFSAANLPPGLTLDPNTGIISGTVATNAASSDPYAVTITAWDPSSNVSVSVTFNWTVNGF